MAPLATTMAKGLLARAPQGLEDVLAAEADAQAILFTTADLAEGRAAFLEKRRPDFKGT